ncbi:MAG TPA: YtfJ family protein [Halioglobus sp.]
MAISRMLCSLVLGFVCTTALATAPTVDSPLPLLVIGERGELIVSGDDFSFVPWRSDTNPGKVHVVQYFGANQSDSKVFEPFTDLLQKSLEPETVHVTTVLNLEAALWGTTGFVMSELKKNKRIHPLATLVVDDKGIGVTEWELGKAGTGLVVMDEKGIVKYFTRQAMSEQDMAAMLELARSSKNQ